MIYALDTNIISYILNGYAGLDERLTVTAKSGNKVVIPIMVYYEVRRGLLANKASNKLSRFERLCSKLNINSMTVSVMNIAARLYAERKLTGKNIDDGDLLIAAECLTNGYTLVSNNEKHFYDIEGLNIENWMK